MQGNRHRMKKGSTLLELIISIAMSLAILGAAFSILSSALLMNRNIIAEKELIEIGEFLHNSLTKEFSRSAEIESVLDKDNVVHTHIGDRFIDIRCVKLIRSKRISYNSPYKEELIYLKDHEADGRGSLWAHKNSNSWKTNIKAFASYRSYEIGTQVDSLKIKRVEGNIFLLELVLKYYDTDIDHRKSFLVKLQD